MIKDKRPLACTCSDKTKDSRLSSQVKEPFLQISDDVKFQVTLREFSEFQVCSFRQWLLSSHLSFCLKRQLSMMVVEVLAGMILMFLSR